jgi:hypothetical protein
MIFFCSLICDRTNAIGKHIFVQNTNLCYSFVLLQQTNNVLTKESLPSFNIKFNEFYVNLKTGIPLCAKILIYGVIFFHIQQKQFFRKISYKFILNIYEFGSILCLGFTKQTKFTFLPVHPIFIISMI